MGKAYISNRFLFLKIGESVEFSNGLFVADTEAQEKVVESNEWYKVHIHPRDLPGETEAEVEAKNIRAGHPPKKK